MNERDTSPIGFFQKYLTVWVILCMAVGICIGKFLPQIPEFLNRFEYARVSIPMAILIWVMIYPMMMKVDFRSIKDVGKNPKGPVSYTHLPPCCNVMWGVYVLGFP